MYERENMNIRNYDSYVSLTPVVESEMTAVDGGFLVIREVVGGGIDFEFFGKYSMTLDKNGATFCGPKSCTTVKPPN
jgi:hypothetical protein